jgi:hypothetical protein
MAGRRDGPRETGKPRRGAAEGPAPLPNHRGASFCRGARRIATRPGPGGARRTGTRRRRRSPRRGGGSRASTRGARLATVGDRPSRTAGPPGAPGRQPVSTTEGDPRWRRPVPEGPAAAAIPEATPGDPEPPAPAGPGGGRRPARYRRPRREFSFRRLPRRPRCRRTSGAQFARTILRRPRDPLARWSRPASITAPVGLKAAIGSGGALAAGGPQADGALSTASPDAIRRRSPGAGLRPAVIRPGLLGRPPGGGRPAGRDRGPYPGDA